MADSTGKNYAKFFGHVALVIGGGYAFIVIISWWGSR